MEEHPDLDGHDPRGQVEFDLDRYGFYIEAAERALAISDRLCVNGTKIRFVGREYRDRRLPEDSDFTIPNPPKGRVLRYYAYEVLRPYKVWGPLVLIPENGDSILSPTILTVE